ncbi:MAG: hypothetical protein DHS20C18_06820 [Saprospiraceae bacterium]|nr:MAG: hypothetical protein DHS20C18_06820 [Saprospiraceae bacterium]
MKKFLKRLLIIFSIFFVLTITILVVLASVFEESIGKRVISEVNKQIKSELTVGGFDLSVIRTFPNLGANLQNVVLKGSRDGVLLEAKEISFRLGLFSLLSSDVKVKSVVVSDGALNIDIDRKGNGNFDIFKTAEGEENSENSGQGTGVSLDQARLNDMKLIYADASTRQNVSGTIYKAVFSGKLSSKQFSLKSNAELESNFIELEKDRYLVGKQLSYNAKVLVDMEKGTYQVDDAEIKIEANRFLVDGLVEVREDATTYYDLVFTGDDVNLASILQMLPQKYLENMQEFQSSGDFEINAAIKGEASQRKNPEIRMDVSLTNGKITNSKMNGSLKDMSFKATFDNGKSQNNASSTFTLKGFKGYFNRELLEFDLEVENLDNPDIDFAMNGVLPLDIVRGLMNDPRISAGSGEIEIKDLQLKGRYQDMINTRRVARVKTHGELEFDDASLTINKEKMIIDRGSLELKDNTLSIKDLKLEGAGSDIVFNGLAYNTIPVLFSDSLNSERSELEFNAELKSSTLDLDRLLALSLVSEEETEGVATKIDSVKEARIQKRERITSYLKGVFNAQVDDFNYNKIEGKDFRGKLNFDNSKLSIEGVTAAMGGNFQLDGMLYFEDEPRLVAKLICDQIDVKEFFRQSEDFGQEVLQSKNLQGNLDAKIAIYAYWDQEGNFDDDKLRVLAGIGIKEGELVGFKMLEDFSTFVNIRDLNHIKFTNLQNFLEVRKRRLTIPVMFIQSNAVNLTVSGEHSFDQEIEYNLKVNAGQVIMAKFKKHDPNLSPQKARRNGFFNLYYSILGTIDDYNFVSAKKRVKSDFELSEMRKRKIREALEKEFGIVELIDEPVDWRDIPEMDTDFDPNNEDYLDWEVEGRKKKNE